MKNKTPAEVVSAFKKIFAQEGRKPLMYIQTDQGKEFENATFHKFLQGYKIKQFSVKSQFKASMVERLNRTIKSKMWRYFTHVGGPKKWLDVLPKLLISYNGSRHRMIGMAPRDVNAENEFELWKTQQEQQPLKRKKHNFKIGQYVRVTKAKGIFAKGYENAWTDEVFTISQILNMPASPVFTFKVADYEWMEIEGLFYTHELQRVTQPTMYRIKKVLRTKKMPNGEVNKLVKWVGYKQPTWTTAQLEKI